MADRTVSVKLVADILGYERGMDRAGEITDRFQSKLDRLALTAPPKLDRVGEAAQKAARGTAELGVSAQAAQHGVGELGDEAEKSGRDMLSLAAKIEVAKLAVHGLSQQFADTGNRGLLGNLRAARRDLSELERVAKTLTPGGGGKSGGSMFGSLGSEAGGLLTSLGGLGSKLRGSLIPILIGGVIAASPIIGSAIGVAVAGGIGAGGVIGGIVLAAKDPRVKSAWSDTGSFISAELHKAALSFVNPMVASAHSLRDIFGTEIGPVITRVFGKLSSVITPFTQGLGLFAHFSAPGFEKLMDVAVSLFDQLAAEMPDLGRSFGDMFTSIANVGPELREFFADALHGTEHLIVGIGNLIEFLAHLYVAAKDVTRVLVALGDGERLAAAFGVDMGKNMDNVSTALSSMMKIAIVSAPQAAGALAAPTEQARIMAGTFTEAATAVGGLSAAFDTLNGKALDQRAADRAAEAAVDDLSAALKNSNGSLSIHTDKGRAAAAAVDALAKAAVTSAQATLDNNGTIEQAAGKYDHYIGQLRATLHQAGYTDAQIGALISTIAKMPTSKSTHVSAPGAAAAAAQVQAIIDAENRLYNKTVHISIVETTSARSGGLQPAHASGTSDAPGGMSWVGERGAELMWVPPHSKIWPHEQSVAMARAYSGAPGYANGVGLGGGMLNLTLDFGAFGKIQRQVAISDALGRGVPQATVRVAYP